MYSASGVHIFTSLSVCKNSRFEVLAMVMKVQVILDITCRRLLTS